MCIDYCFMGTHRTPAKRVPILVLRDTFSKSTLAYVVGRKGAVDWDVDSVIRDLGEWCDGRSRIAIKSDQEDSIVALKHAIVAKRSAETVPKRSVKRDPPSH